MPHAGGVEALRVAGALLDGGASALQLRAKESTRDERRALALELGALCARRGRPFVVNDDLELALEGLEGVTGIHLGQEDLRAHQPAVLSARVRDAGLQLGVSTHNLVQVRAARAWRPDVLGFGPVFGTGTKDRPDPTTGIEQLRRACAEASVPVVAIGGIDLAGATACFEAGAAMVAVIGALIADDPARIRALAAEFCSVAHSSPSAGS